MSVVLACDLGGSRFRAALIDEAGEIGAIVALPGPMIRGGEGRAEVDPDDWWKGLISAAGQLAAAAPALFAGVEAVAICGITRTQVFVGRDGRSLGPAPTWKDIRSEPMAARLLAMAQASHPEAAHLNAFHPLARIMQFKQDRPADFEALAAVLEPKDWLNFRLTGRAAGDTVSLARVIAAAKPGSAGGPNLFSRAGVPITVLPPVLEPWGVIGRVLPDLPAPLDRLAGVPVFCGSNDTWAAVLGLGAMRPGYAYNISGTTEVLGIVGRGALTAEGLLTVDWRGFWQLGGPSQNGADTATWLVGLVGRGSDPATLGTDLETLLREPRDPQPLLFLPYLQGERVPYWDSGLRGAFVGLNRRHGPADLAWAMLEGVAFLNRIVLERAEAAAGRPVDEIRFGGGASASAAWRQIKADVCGRPIVRGHAPEPGLLGAACLAWTGLGRFRSLDEAQARLVREAARSVPDPARKRGYDDLFALYRRSEAALSPISHELARFHDPNLPGLRTSAVGLEVRP